MTTIIDTSISIITTSAVPSTLPPTATSNTDYHPNQTGFISKEVSYIEDHLVESASDALASALAALNTVIMDLVDIADAAQENSALREGLEVALTAGETFGEALSDLHTVAGPALSAAIAESINTDGKKELNTIDANE
jgi:hypothetical protein